ncbi:hypothetical protein O181_064720 [Austropuccinia psidii MF-1]|uniref:Uncharacterized protein n=1 Tax=Austropuccinia psidii MF-1 TaxID=1389203 RepID=A0A9Q3ETP2_9BASI|nr:hypothetical protein [Austropuccinia psidii MF-1]
MPHEQTLQQPTPGPGGTQWLEDFSCEPSQHNDPPIPGLSPSSEPPEDIPTCEPEPEVALMQSTEESFACLATPCLVIIIDDMPVGSPLPNSSTFPSCDPRNPTPPPSWCQARLIPTMTLARNLPN